MVSAKSVSIVVINFNYEQYVLNAIESVLDQSSAVHQLVVVDDGSTDSSVSVINSFLADRFPNVIFIEKNNGGMVSAANEAFKYITSDYVIFLDADDELLTNCVETIKPHLVSGPALLHYPLNLINSSDEHIGTFPNLNHYTCSAGNSVASILRTGFYVKTSTSGNVYRASALRELFPIEDHIYAKDGDYYSQFPLDAYLTNKILYFGPLVAVNEPLGCYRMHDNNNGAGKTIWNSNQKRVRVLELMQNDIAFYSKRFEHDFESLILRDPRLLLNCVIQDAIETENIPVRGAKVTLRLIWLSFQNNLFERNIRFRHKLVIFTLIVLIPNLPRRLISRFIS
jgi:glycosyltransferase involved in cell wall biosynthesis